MGKSNWYDMREFMQFLETKDDIAHIQEEVDPEWEVNGITRIGLQESGPAIVFDRIRGADMPMVTNLLGADRRFLWAMGIDEWGQFNEEWLKRTQTLVPPKIIESGFDIQFLNFLQDIFHLFGIVDDGGFR